MKEFLVLLLKTFGLIIVGIVGVFAWLWLPNIVYNFTSGEAAYCISLIVGALISIATLPLVQLQLDYLWNTDNYNYN